MDTQSDFEEVIKELGPSGKWNDRAFTVFYKQFIQESLNSNSVILEITDVKQMEQRVFLTAVVLNVDTFWPYMMPDSEKPWTLQFFYDADKGCTKGHMLFAKVRKLRNMNAKENLVEINTSTIRIAKKDEEFSYKYGFPFVRRLKNAFGSLEGVSDFIIAEFKADVEEAMDLLNNQLENKVDKMNEEEETIKQKHDKRKNELQNDFNRLEEMADKKENQLLAEHEKIEEELKRDHLEKLQAFEEKKAALEKYRKHYTKEKERIAKEYEELHHRERRLNEQKNVLQKQFDQCLLVNPLKEKSANTRQEEPVAALNWQEQACIADTVRRALFTQCGLAYEKRVIDEFIACLHTDIFMILNGPSGTGKSSLAEAFSEVVEGVEMKTIRVQSSWTDNQDLLGFFNPIDYQYIPTPFLDTLYKASRNQDRLYIINLDEMNLAHVEYYFAELLSAREKIEKGVKRPEITLYSEHFMEIARLVIRLYVYTDEDGQQQLETEKLLPLSASDRIRIQNCFDLIHKYPAAFPLPANVRFIGTMNMDQTVKGLSPKVIDRSFLISIDHPKDRDSLYAELKDKAVDDRIFLDMKSDLVFPKKNTEVEEQFETLNKHLEMLKARLNPRALDQIGRLVRVLPEATAFESIVSGKVLPRINVPNHPSMEKAFHGLKGQVQAIGASRVKMDDMVTRGNTITYWR